MIFIFLISFISKLQAINNSVTHFYHFDNNLIKYVLNGYSYPDNFEIKNLIEERYTISTLIFENCKIVKMPSDIFKTLKSLEYLNMTKSGLEYLGDSNFQNARHLKRIDAPFNSITKLDDFTFSGASTVTRLDLSHNEITDLQIGSFKGLVKLSILNLSFNKITKLSSKFLFHDNMELTTIKLNDNRIHTIVKHPGPFSSLKKLTFLFLNNNFLKDFEEADLTVEDLEIGNNQLTGLIITNDLKRVSAENNQISSIYVISPLNLIERLWIHTNNITDIINLAQFSKMTNLVFLHASQNPIKDLTPIKKNHALEKLYLSYTQQSSIDLKIFSKLKLKLLDISHNNMKKIDFNQIEINENMEELDINDNGLTEFDYKKMTEKFPSIKKIHISRNVFNCSYLESIFNYTDKKSIEVANDRQLNFDQITNVRNMHCFPKDRVQLEPLIKESIMDSFESFAKAILEEQNILENLNDDNFNDNVEDDLYELTDRHFELERKYEDFIKSYHTLTVFVGLLMAGVISLVIFKIIVYYLKRRNRINYTTESRPFNEFINDENLS